MSCVDYKTWQAAKQACSARLSVKGFGYVEMGRVNLRALRGLGDLNINTAATIDPNDPCSIASMTPCPTFSIPAPYQPPASSTPSSSTTPASTSAAGGFRRWGLLAALAAGGGALYLVMRKKS